MLPIKKMIISVIDTAMGHLVRYLDWERVKFIEKVHIHTDKFKGTRIKFSLKFLFVTISTESQNEIELTNYSFAWVILNPVKILQKVDCATEELYTLTYFKRLWIKKHHRNDVFYNVCIPHEPLWLRSSFFPYLWWHVGHFLCQTLPFIH